ncbi:universal stress protein [Actinomadura rifamycini]|uniref:universal stress protein n=1 Tax=Actinomadura rifamycini TaxID=31962 RepID=UPI000405918C|nr:universal stress protein [Actinomadura rifamycini]
MSNPIVVGIDGSAHAWRALDWAADRAVRHGLDLRLVHGSRAVAEDGHISPRALRPLVAEREDLLAEARQYALKIHPDLRIETRLLPLEPGRALVREGENADMVTVGSRGLGGFEGLLFGSVGLYTAAHAACPVLVVSRSAPYPPDAPAEIVVGVEGRPGDDAAVEWAFTEAASKGAETLALHAVGGEIGSPRWRVIEDMELSQALAGMGTRYPDVPVRPLISDRTPSQALVEASEKAGLIVLGARRRRGVLGMALGRVNHAVLHHARCPVLIVPTGE